MYKSTEGILKLQAFVLRKRGEMCMNYHITKTKAASFKYYAVYEKYVPDGQ